MAVIEGARKRPFSNAGAPTNGTLNGQASKGDLCIDSTNGVAYVNTGTLAATVWVTVGSQT